MTPQTTSSCGSGPDAQALKTNPFTVPFSAVSAAAPMLETPFLATPLTTAPVPNAGGGGAGDQYAAMQQLAMLMSTFQQSQSLIQGLSGGDVAAPAFDPNLLASLLLPMAGAALPPQAPLLRSPLTAPESMPVAVSTVSDH